MERDNESAEVIRLVEALAVADEVDKAEAVTWIGTTYHLWPEQFETALVIGDLVLIPRATLEAVHLAHKFLDQDGDVKAALYQLRQAFPEAGDMSRSDGLGG